MKRQLVTNANTNKKQLREMIIIDIQFDFVVSDTHFNHENIIKYTKRPFNSAEEMDRHMIAQWNKVVNKDDKVLHLGDFALGLSFNEYAELLQRLNGDIYLIQGNHDRFGKKKGIKMGFKEIYRKLVVDQIIFTHKPLKEVPKGYANVHGHTHNFGEKISMFHLCVSPERTKYTPIRYKDVITALTEISAIK